MADKKTDRKADKNEFWDSLRENSRKAANLVAQQATALAEAAQKKTKETMDGIKLDREIKKVQGILKDEYEMLGQLSYSIESGLLRRDDTILQASVKRIDRCKKRLEELEEQRGGHKEPEPEPESPEEEEEELFAAAGEEPEEEEEDDGFPMMKFCPHCHAGNALTATNCVACGHKLD